MLNVGKYKQLFAENKFCCVDSFLEEPFAQQVANSFPPWDDAVKLGVTFLGSWQKKKAQIRNVDALPTPIGDVVTLMQSRLLCDELSKLTGIPHLLPDPELHGGGVHVTRRGGSLDLHVDFCRHKTRPLFRRLNVILYLTPNWEYDWGGEFEVWDPDSENTIAKVSPQFNRAVIMETTDTSFHGVRKVKCPSSITRNSLAFYYYTEEPPCWYKEDFGTVFATKPHQYLRRNVVLPAEKLAYRARDWALRQIAKRLDIT